MTELAKGRGDGIDVSGCDGVERTSKGGEATGELARLLPTTLTSHRRVSAYRRAHALRGRVGPALNDILISILISCLAPRDVGVGSLRSPRCQTTSPRPHMHSSPRPVPFRSNPRPMSGLCAHAIIYLVLAWAWAEGWDEGLDEGRGFGLAPHARGQRVPCPLLSSPPYLSQAALPSRHQQPS